MNRAYVSIDQLFEQMDRWRHLPSYQLERRADLFFSLYLQQVLEEKVGTAISPILIPEFPIQKKSIGLENSNRSFKVDYLAFSKDGKKAFLIELKTDMGSRTKEQDDYLIRAKAVGFQKLLEGVIQIFRGKLDRQTRKKYFALLHELEILEQLILPKELPEMLTKSSFQGIAEIIDGIDIASKVETIDIMYVQPIGNGDNIINFDEFATTIVMQKEPLAIRFAQSLRQWAKNQAGDNS